jgi:hypothetical protein
MPATDLPVLRRRPEPEPPAPAPGNQGPQPFQQRPKASNGPGPAPRRLAGRDPNTPYRSPWAADSLDRKTPAVEPLPDPTPSPEPPPPPPFAASDSSNGDNRAANEVYGFLSSFTAGVQRGLDEARQDAEDGSPDDESDS